MHVLHNPGLQFPRFPSYAFGQHLNLRASTQHCLGTLPFLLAHQPIVKPFLAEDAWTSRSFLIPLIPLMMWWRLLTWWRLFTRIFQLFFTNINHSFDTSKSSRIFPVRYRGQGWGVGGAQSLILRHSRSFTPELKAREARNSDDIMEHWRCSCRILEIWMAGTRILMNPWSHGGFG